MPGAFAALPLQLLQRTGITVSTTWTFCLAPQASFMPGSRILLQLNGHSTPSPLVACGKWCLVLPSCHELWLIAHLNAPHCMCREAEEAGAGPACHLQPCDHQVSDVHGCLLKPPPSVLIRSDAAFQTACLLSKQERHDSTPCRQHPPPHWVNHPPPSARPASRVAPTIYSRNKGDDAAVARALEELLAKHGLRANSRQDEIAVRSLDREAGRRTARCWVGRASKGFGGRGCGSAGV